jgi:hypothetical protein
LPEREAIGCVSRSKRDSWLGLFGLARSDRNEQFVVRVSMVEFPDR